jgi:hypothetical protein
MPCTVVKVTDVSEDRTACRFRIGEQRAWNAMSFDGVHVSEDLHYGLGYGTM